MRALELSFVAHTAVTWNCNSDYRKRKRRRRNLPKYKLFQNNHNAARQCVYLERKTKKDTVVEEKQQEYKAEHGRGRPEVNTSAWMHEDVF